MTDARELFMKPDLVCAALPDDERVWVPQADSIWFRPLLLNTVRGQWINLLRVRKAGVLSRHNHISPIFGYVLKGAWHYLEHDWTAREGDFIFEPPGEIHTLVVDEGYDEMITLFNVTGCMLYVDENHEALGYEDVFTKIDLFRKHYAEVGLGEDFANQFIR
jgi:2,4'-dihydroxyacetophenone dioxygenase